VATVKENLTVQEYEQRHLVIIENKLDESTPPEDERTAAGNRRFIQEICHSHAESSM